MTDTPTLAALERALLEAQTTAGQTRLDYDDAARRAADARQRHRKKEQGVSFTEADEAVENALIDLESAQEPLPDLTEQVRRARLTSFVAEVVPQLQASAAEVAERRAAAIGALADYEARRQAHNARVLNAASHIRHNLGELPPTIMAPAFGPVRAQGYAFDTLPDDPAVADLLLRERGATP